MKLIGRGQVEGRGRGAIVAIPPLSFWGGYDAETGRVIDHSHPALGRYLVAKVLVMPNGRGSSSSSSVLAEAIRLATAPAAIVLAEPDPILATGAIVAQALYRRSLPDHRARARRPRRRRQRERGRSAGRARRSVGGGAVRGGAEKSRRRKIEAGVALGRIPGADVG